MYYIVESYLDKKMLAGLGYTFNGGDISDFELKAYRAISNELNRINKEGIGKKDGNRDQSIN